MTDTHPIAVATGSWTSEEDAKLTRAVAKTSEKKYGKVYRIDWAAVAAIVPARTKWQCKNRWKDALDPSFDGANGRTGKWTAHEDFKLKDAVQTHGGKNWAAIAALVAGRTKRQCRDRWHNASDPSITRVNKRTGRWTEDEASKLQDAVRMHGSKDWAAITALVPGRTRNQCWCRWKNVLDPSIDRTSPGRTGKWIEDEDTKLKDAVLTHGGKDWAAVAALVPGRNRNQCRFRWRFVLDPNIDRVSRRTGKWAEDDDIKLKVAVQTHGGKNWVAIGAMVAGRTENQCKRRWHDFLKHIIDRTTERTGTWTEEENFKLQDAVHTKGGNNWAAIAALVPGRTKTQCYDRWKDVLDPSIALTAGRTGKWAEDEEIKLKDAVQTHGDNNWVVIAAQVPGRTRNQCRDSWQNALDPRIDWANGRTGKWTAIDDSNLKDAVQTHGAKNWKEISSPVPGRTKVQCRGRWWKALDPNIDRSNEHMGKQAEDEDIKTKVAVQAHDGKNGVQLPRWFPVELEKCCSTWHNALDPSIDRAHEREGKWKEYEVNKLKDSVQMHSGKNWAAIATLVPGRTKKQCWDRWMNYIWHYHQ